VHRSMLAPWNRKYRPDRRPRQGLDIIPLPQAML
jgi:hypothetical protein